jgi:hypothetical protein
VRTLGVSLALAGALFAVTAGTALMATPTVGASCDADNGLVTVSFIYDASQTPPPITTVEAVNNDSKSVVAGINFYNQDLTLLHSFSGSVPPGDNSINVTALNQHMVQFTGKFGTSWVFPFIVSCSS